MSNSPVIECKNLCKQFVDAANTIEIFKGLDLTVSSGEKLAIVGSSGSGKSTLLQLMGGLDLPTEGAVEVAGKNIHNLSEAKRAEYRNQHLGFVYQFHHLLSEFTALENVSMPLLLRKMKSEEAFEKASTLLKSVGLSERETHRVGELSGGERQRVAIARALVTNPACVLADEPTGNLDQKTAQHVMDLVLQLNQESNVAFVIVTHDTQIANQMEKILLLKDGALE